MVNSAEAMSEPPVVESSTLAVRVIPVSTATGFRFANTLEVMGPSQSHSPTGESGAPFPMVVLLLHVFSTAPTVTPVLSRQALPVLFDIMLSSTVLPVEVAGMGGVEEMPMPIKLSRDWFPMRTFPVDAKPKRKPSTPLPLAMFLSNMLSTAASRRQPRPLPSAVFSSKMLFVPVPLTKKPAKPLPLAVLLVRRLPVALEILKPMGAPPTLLSMAVLFMRVLPEVPILRKKPNWLFVAVLFVRVVPVLPTAPPYIEASVKVCDGAVLDCDSRPIIDTDAPSETRASDGVASAV